MDEWRTLVLLDEVPVARVRLPHPGAASAGFRRAAVHRHADAQRAYRDLLERVERRLGVPRRTPARLTVSAVVCTHRRPLMVTGLLEAMARLDPRPDEILVVDNDPGALAVREAALAAGARYVREERRGLDRARTAGLEAARSDVVAFIDDDCVPSPGWLRALPELFDDPRVGAVTGPAFAHELDTEAQLAFEDSGGFGRGFHRRVHEWTNLSPPGASRAGAGANMILRRSAAVALEGLFPPDLDAGTPTRSGGDLYALYRMLSAGHRVVYDPGTYVLHRHRADMESMHETFRGYGTGLAAALTKMLVEQRDLSALGALWWLAEQWVRAQRAPRGDVQREIANDYVLGALRGPRAWRAARALTVDRSPSTGRAERTSGTSAVPAREPATVNGQRSTVNVSVLIATHDRPQALQRCLASLRRQVDGTPPFELIVANDAQAPLGEIEGARVIETGGPCTGAARNAAAAAARGRLLLFLDDDLVAERDLVKRHAEAHAEGSERVVIGYCKPAPRRQNLASLGACAWWEDHYRALRHAAALTFMDVLSGNMSVPRQTFERLGGFDAALSRREDWEWGLRALEAGIEVVYEPSARARHEFVFGTRRALAAARSHGRCDAALIARRPELAASLPVRWSSRSMLRRPLKAVLFLAAQRPLGLAAGCALLDLLEIVKARPSWSRLFTLLHGATYERGRREGGDPRLPSAPPPVAEIELDSDEPIPRPEAIAPRVRVLAGGQPLVEFSTHGGHWGRGLAEQIAAAGYRELLARNETAPAPETSVEVIEERDWSARDARIRASAADAVVVALAQPAGDEHWSAQVAEALEAERVALAIGAGTDAGGPSQPLTVHSRATNPERFPRIGRPPAYLALRRDFYELVGGIDPRAVALGDQAVVLELCQRVLEAGWLVSRRDVPGLAPARPELLERISRRRARAALLARRPAYRSAAPPPLPAAASRSGVSAAQRCGGVTSPAPAERPFTRSG